MIQLPVGFLDQLHAGVETLMDALTEVWCSMFGESKGGGGISSFVTRLGRSSLAGVVVGGMCRGEDVKFSLNTSE
jgi:hypothetical protein